MNFHVVLHTCAIVDLQKELEEIDFFNLQQASGPDVACLASHYGPAGGNTLWCDKSCAQIQGIALNARIGLELRKSIADPLPHDEV